MSGFANAAQSPILALIFQAVAWASVAQNNATSPYTNAYLSLHSADPTNAGNQSSSEILYTGYTRLPVSRIVGSWTISGSSPTIISNAAQLQFGLCTAGGPVTASYVGIGWAASGAGILLMVSSVLATPLIINPAVQPTIAIGGAQWGLT